MTEKERKDRLKKRLNQYRDLKAEHGQILAEYNALADPKSPNLDGMPKGPSTGDPMASIATQRQQLAEKYRAKLEELAAAQSDIENMIEGLESRDRKLMRHRYIEGLTWEAVCVAINYGWSQTHDIHGKALDQLVAAEMEKEATLCQLQTVSKAEK